MGKLKLADIREKMKFTNTLTMDGLGATTYINRILETY